MVVGWQLCKGRQQRRGDPRRRCSLVMPVAGLHRASCPSGSRTRTAVPVVPRSLDAISERPAQLFDALAHPGNADARGASAAGDVLERGLGNAVALVFDLEHERAGVTPQPDACGLAPRVAVDVDERLLDDSEEGGFGVER